MSMSMNMQEEDDESWEVRAFAQDTTSVMGTTWPPRSYTCSFCRREFRSAQALGGHMNVHRRDRARLHHHHHQPPPAAPASGRLIPPHHHHQDLLFLYHHFPNPDNNVVATTPNTITTTSACCGEESSSVSPSTLLSITPFFPSSSSNNHLLSLSTSSSTTSPTTTPTTPSFDFQGLFLNSSHHHTKEELVEEVQHLDLQVLQPPASSFAGGNAHDELDLELRLGNRPTPT